MFSDKWLTSKKPRMFSDKWLTSKKPRMFSDKWLTSKKPWMFSDKWLDLYSWLCWDDKSAFKYAHQSDSLFLVAYKESIVNNSEV